MADISIESPCMEGRTLVRLRVAMRDVGVVMGALQLPAGSSRSSGNEIFAVRFAPDQWLLTSVRLSADEVVRNCDAALRDSLYCCTDASDAIACIAVEGGRGRQILGMLSAADFGLASFPAGHCVRARMAKIAVIICAMTEYRFELFLDRSLQRYLQDCLERAAGLAIVEDLPFASDRPVAS